MDFIIIANAWSAGKDNPTSKHRIALELVRQGHRVLWIEGSGMRTPSVGSSHDRLRMVRKVVSAFRGARPEECLQGSGFSVQVSNPADVLNKSPAPAPLTPEPRTLTSHSLWVLSPLFIPVPRFELIRRLNGLICRVSMRFWGWRLGFRDPVLINYVPVLAEAMRCGLRREKGATSCAGVKVLREESSVIPLTTQRFAPRIVYHCVDRWDAFAMYDSAMMGEMDRRCCRYADVVIASAGELYDRCRQINPNTILVPHGVDWDHFRQAVSDHLPPHPVVGFFGLLSEWVDQELLLKLARECASAKIVLIGKADVSVEQLENIPNVDLLGPKPFSELPAMVAQFTVGIIPFVVNDLTRSVNPIKLREMLSAGCPVVSTALPEVELYAKGEGQGAGSEGERTGGKLPGVQVAHGHDEFIAMVRKVVSSPFSAEERRALSDSMAGETWAAKVREIVRLVE